jgi:hypothetical protein
MASKKPTGFGRGANTSGQGGKGKAPYSRGPIVAAVKPSGVRNLNGNGNQGPAKTGGGEGSRSHVKITPVTGSPQTRITSPDAVSNAGRSVGNHSMNDGKVLQRPGVPLHQPAQAPSRLGNDMALNVGRGGPGAGRFLHGPSGSQGTYSADANSQGTIAADRSIVAPGPRNTGGKPLATRPMGAPQGGGGPGSFGFRPGSK